MKKKISFLAMIILILAAIFIWSTVYAKPYKSLTISLAIPDYTAEIPDDAVLPDYLSRLEWAKTVYERTSERSTLILDFFKDPEFQYFDEIGNEIVPYVEVIKLERSADGYSASVHLIAIMFINKENMMELYTDKEAVDEPATDKLQKVDKDDKTIFRKVPRKNI